MIENTKLISAKETHIRATDIEIKNGVISLKIDHDSGVNRNCVNIALLSPFGGKEYLTIYWVDVDGVECISDDVIKLQLNKPIFKGEEDFFVIELNYIEPVPGGKKGFRNKFIAMINDWIKWDMEINGYSDPSIEIIE